MRRVLIFAFLFAVLVTSIGCSADYGELGSSDAELASYKLSYADEQFEIYRRVVFYNGITDEYILMVEGYCSIEVDPIDNQLELTVKLSDSTFVKHFVGLSDNVIYFVEQLDPATISDDQYRIVFKPPEIVPAIEVEAPAQPYQ